MQILREFLASDTDYEEEQHVEHLERCKGLRMKVVFGRYYSSMSIHFISVAYIIIRLHVHIYIYTYIPRDE